MRYFLKNRNHIVFSVPSPYYDGRCSVSRPLILRDGESDGLEALQRDFMRAVGLFSEEIKKLPEYDDALTEEGKEKFAASLRALLELHTILKERQEER